MKRQDAAGTEKGMVSMDDYSALKKIFHNIDCLSDGYHELPEAQEADEELKKYLRENFLNGDEAGIKGRWLELTGLINHAEAENELQGFISGFRYAVELFMKGGRPQQKSDIQDNTCTPDTE